MNEYEEMDEESEDILDLQYMSLDESDEEMFKDIYDRLDEYMGNEDNETPFVAPEDRISARDWLLASLKIEDEIKYLKEVYIKELEKRYIAPVKEKIEKHNDALEILKQGLRQFLENAEERKVDFPDLASVGQYDAAEKIIYPEDEKEFAKMLHDNNSGFIRITPSLDKKEIQKFYKENKELPFEELRVEPGKKSVRITRKK